MYKYIRYALLCPPIYYTYMYICMSINKNGEHKFFNLYIDM